MDKTWFHHCLTGLLGLSAIRKDEMKAMLEEHPSQANMRMVFALKVSSQKATKGKVIIQDAFYLPDRKALFLQQTLGQYGIVNPAKMTATPLTSKSGNTREGAAQITTPGRIVPLPQYTPPEVATEELDQEVDELEGLEHRLLAGLEEEDLTRDWEDVGPANVSASHNQEPPVRRPIMERFDTEMGRIDEAPSLHPPLPAFLDWLQHLPAVTPDKPPIEEEGQAHDPEWESDDIPSSYRNQDASKPTKEVPIKDIKEASPSKKQKRKQKKIAKKLAKESIKANQEVASETLAALLASQGHADQAIAMYDRLSLLFPEKKSTFAGQIAKLKRKDP